MAENKQFCRVIDRIDYLEQCETYTEAALRDLLDVLEKRPEVYVEVQKRRIQDEEQGLFSVWGLLQKFISWVDGSSADELEHEAQLRLRELKKELRRCFEAGRERRRLLIEMELEKGAVPARDDPFSSPGSTHRLAYTHMLPDPPPTPREESSSSASPVRNAAKANLNSSDVTTTTNSGAHKPHAKQPFINSQSSCTDTKTREPMGGKGKGPEVPVRSAAIKPSGHSAGHSRALSAGSNRHPDDAVRRPSPLGANCSARKEVPVIRVEAPESPSRQPPPLPPPPPPPLPAAGIAPNPISKKQAHQNGAAREPSNGQSASAGNKAMATGSGSGRGALLAEIERSSIRQLKKVEPPSARLNRKRTGSSVANKDSGNMLVHALRKKFRNTLDTTTTASNALDSPWK